MLTLLCNSVTLCQDSAVKPRVLLHWHGSATGFWKHCLGDWSEDDARRMHFRGGKPFWGRGAAFEVPRSMTPLSLQLTVVQAQRLRQLHRCFWKGSPAERAHFPSLFLKFQGLPKMIQKKCKPHIGFQHRLGLGRHSRHPLQQQFPASPGPGRAMEAPGAPAAQRGPGAQGKDSTLSPGYEFVK